MKVTMFMPRFNPNDDEFEVMKWHISDQTWVEKGQELVEVESAKATICLESEISGFVVRACAAGTVIPVGAPLAFFYNELAELNDSDYSCNHQELAQSSAKETTTISNSVAARTTTTLANPATFSKPALAYLEEHKLDATLFDGMGLVSLPILLKRLAESTHSPVPVTQVALTPQAVIQEPVTQNTLPILRSKTVTLSKKIEIERLSAGQIGGVNSSLTVQFNSAKIRQNLASGKLFDGALAGQLLPLILHELAQLLKEHSDFTAYYDHGYIYYYDQVNIGVAVDLGQGLKVPVIRQADSRSPIQLFEMIARYVSIYHEKQISSELLSGGTITVTDLSNDDILYFQPLLNEKQSVILGIGGDRTMDGSPMTLTLVFDHRVLSGRQVGLFLNALKHRLLKFGEEPLLAQVTDPVEFVASSARVYGWHPRTAITRRTQLPAGPYLLFADPFGLSQAIYQTLKQSGHICIMVESTTQFAKLNHTHYQINPADQLAYQQLFQLLAEDALSPTQLFYLWSYGDVRENVDNHVRIAQELLSALTKLKQTQRPHALYLVSRHLQPDVATIQNSGDCSSPSLLTVTRKEVPWLRCAQIDLQNEKQSEDRNSLLRELLTVSKEHEIIYHASQRWTRLLGDPSVAPTLTPEKLIGWTSKQGLLQVVPATPRTELEESLINLWLEVLNIKTIRIYDNFFALGGHSLLATQVLSRIHTSLQINLTLQQLFAHPTVAGLAHFIENLQQIARPVLAADDEREEGAL